MTQIQAKVIADSITPQGDRLTTLIVTMPRIILAEFNTHRMFSRNTSSSRAIPFEKMVESVQKDSFIPIAWQKDHKGMQGSKYFDDIDYIQMLEEDWLESRDNAVRLSKRFNNNGATKQLCNRLLEPFMWTTVIVSATDFSNFFELRCPQYKLVGLGGEPVKSKKEWLNRMQLSSALHPSQYPQTDLEWLQYNQGQAEIHMMALAEAMYDAYNESEPRKLSSGQWHIPFNDQMDYNDIYNIVSRNGQISFMDEPVDEMNSIRVKIATAMCARTSYTVIGAKEKKPNYEADIQLHDFLLAQQHLSPFEHCAMVPLHDSIWEKGMTHYTADDPHHVGSGSGRFYKWSANFRGWIQYRQLIDNDK